jgi:hypothetical protein
LALDGRRVAHNRSCRPSSSNSIDPVAEAEAEAVAGPVDQNQIDPVVGPVGPTEAATKAEGARAAGGKADNHFGNGYFRGGQTPSPSFYNKHLEP